MNAKKLAFFTFISIFGLAGCAPAPRNGVTVINATNVDDPAQVKLAEAAVSVSQSLQQLAAMEQATHPSIQMPPPPNPMSIGMSKLATVDWNGPVEPLVRKIAAATHYQVRVLGKTPAITVLVFIRAENTPLADILRDVGFQVARKADIIIYPKSRVIELRYLPYSSGQV